VNNKIAEILDNTLEAITFGFLMATTGLVAYLVALALFVAVGGL
jgi:hypothetical protein